MNKRSIFHVVFVLVVGCGEGPAGANPEAATGEGPSTGESPTSGAGDTDEPSTGLGTTGSQVPPDGGVGDGQCDPWQQDCPAGYKCMAFAEEDEASFSGNKCTPVVPSAKTVGDPCSVEGGWWSGIDDCDQGLVCWDINQETNTGHCVPLCTGSAEAHDCPSEDDVCVFWVPGISHVCLASCDPLVQDCDPGQACLPEWSSNAAEWVCAAEYSFDEGQEFDPCAFSNVCDPGLMCWDPGAAIECAGAETGCCLALCDLGAPQCNGEGAECTPFYEVIEGQAPPEFADVGLCVLPG